MKSATEHVFADDDVMLYLRPKFARKDRVYGALALRLGPWMRLRSRPELPLPNAGEILVLVDDNGGNLWLRCEFRDAASMIVSY